MHSTARNVRTARPVAALAVPVVVLSGGAGVFGLAAPALADGEGPPAFIQLTGIVRDFHERSDDNGHPDFEKQPDGGFGLYCGNVALMLGEDDRPVFTGDGKKVYRQYRDDDDRPIARHMYNRRWTEDGQLVWDSSLDDDAGDTGGDSTGGIQSAATFAQWFSNHPGTNMAAPLSLTFVRQDDGSYVFDDKLDPLYDDLGGFFPIEEQLFGNPGGSPDRNFHFTFALATEFTYDADADQVFKFVGDDDVWVFIDRKLAIDLGGVHSATEQFIDLDRMGLVDGETYELHFFFAERHRTQSNFRIETNLELESLPLPSISASFD